MTEMVDLLLKLGGLRILLSAWLKITSALGGYQIAAQSIVEDETAMD